jgi:hypothetical protein
MKLLILSCGDLKGIGLPILRLPQQIEANPLGNSVERVLQLSIRTDI